MASQKCIHVATKEDHANVSCCTCTGNCQVYQWVTVTWDPPSHIDSLFRGHWEALLGLYLLPMWSVLHVKSTLRVIWCIVTTYFEVLYEASEDSQPGNLFNFASKQSKGSRKLQKAERRTKSRQQKVLRHFCKYNRECNCTDRIYACTMPTSFPGKAWKER